MLSKITLLTREHYYLLQNELPKKGGKLLCGSPGIRGSY